MLAFLYLALIFVLGDAICRRFFVYASAPHRYGTAFLGGLLISGCWTYLSSLLFARTVSPMFWGNIVFMVTATALVLILDRRPLPEGRKEVSLVPVATEKWDWIMIGIFLAFTSWMMFRTFNMSGGRLQIGHHEYTDFSATLSIMQSFAQGTNFPTEFPLFAGEKIRSYFLFYFQAGNLEYLGLGPALSNNILAILSTTSMLALVMTLGRVLFDSRAAGTIGAVLFFFHGSLSFIPFLSAQTSLAGLIEKLSTMTTFLNSGLPHRGEDWGIWSQNVFLTQRNLASSIGLLLIMLIFLIMRYRQFYAQRPHEDTGGGDSKRESAGSGSEADQSEANPATENLQTAHLPSPAPERRTLAPYIFCGVLLGLMPMWNGAVLVQAMLLLGVLLILFPLRREMLVLLGVSAILAVPQLIYLQMGARPTTFSYFHWGYLLDNPSVLTVLYYLMFTFGVKWLLIGIGTVMADSFGRRFMAAVSSLLIFAFCTQLTEELLVNHKFFNIWLVIVNVYAGYGLVRLWRLKVAGTLVPARVAAVVLGVLVTIAGAIDLMPVRNSYFIEMSYDGDKLVDWIKTSTDPRAVFLSHRYMHHQIILAGRRIFFGEQYYVWEAGYDTAARDAIYKRMFESTDPAEVFRLLKENNIKYVAIDDAIRSGRNSIKQPNEALYQRSCKLVFDDIENRYANIRIYEVP